MRIVGRSQVRKGANFGHRTFDCYLKFLVGWQALLGNNLSLLADGHPFVLGWEKRWYD